LPHKGETALIFCPSRGVLRRGSDGLLNSDFTLIASPYERYGTPEAVSMIYGSLPLAPASGAARDTLVPLEVHANRGNAFPFRNARVGNVAGAIERAMQFHQEPGHLRTA
jgi:glycogen synthase